MSHGDHIYQERKKMSRTILNNFAARRTLTDLPVRNILLVVGPLSGVFVIFHPRLGMCNVRRKKPL